MGYKLKTIPIIDLFAGPGGLGEGFSSVKNKSGDSIFKIALSVEMEHFAHRTLTMRSFYRQFIYKNKPIPDEYYKYISGDITRDELFEKYPYEANAAQEEAVCAELGNEECFPHDTFFDDKISKALKGQKDWVLIGGPPCQAYSLVGRSRQTGGTENEKARIQKLAAFEQDHRHTLYKQYLRIIARHSPSVFVMENVKGILSSKLNGELIFPNILRDLKNPYENIDDSWSKDCEPHTYRILSFVKKNSIGSQLENNDYVIKSENHGIPQARHRVILLGIREDFYTKCVKHMSILSQEPKVSVSEVIDDLPPLRSGLSKTHDGNEEWSSVIRKIPESDWYKKLSDKNLQNELANIASYDKSDLKKGNNYYRKHTVPASLSEWYSDDRMKVTCNHEARSHIVDDIIRYAFVSCYGKVHKKSPSLEDFPVELLPAHKNIDLKNVKISAFADRFRVQVGNKPSTTVTCHISKDGHYFIHHKPEQVRSLTVREAARLQTFPDNYFFEGQRTAQYHQVGNAVPPLLAEKLGQIVAKLFTQSKK